MIAVAENDPQGSYHGESKRGDQQISGDIQEELPEDCMLILASLYGVCAGYSTTIVRGLQNPRFCCILKRVWN